MANNIQNPPASGIPANPELAASRMQKVQSNGAAPGVQAPTNAQQTQESNDFSDDELFGELGLSEEDQALLGDGGDQNLNPGTQGGPGQPGTQQGGTQQQDDQQTADPNAQNQQQTQPNAQQQPPIDMAKAREAAEKQLEDTVYALDDDTKNKLISEPDKVLPKLAARLHLQVLQNVASYVPQIVNRMVESQLGQRFAAHKAETGFFGKYPGLAAVEHRATVLNSLKTIKAMNPQATREEIEREGAQLAAFNLQRKGVRVDIGSPQQTRQQQPQQRAPVQQQRQPVRQQPFSPASPGGASGAQQTPQLEAGQLDWSEAVKSDWWD